MSKLKEVLRIEIKPKENGDDEEMGKMSKGKKRMEMMKKIEMLKKKKKGMKGLEYEFYVTI